MSSPRSDYIKTYLTNALFHSLGRFAVAWLPSVHLFPDTPPEFRGWFPFLSPSLLVCIAPDVVFAHAAVFLITQGCHVIEAPINSIFCEPLFSRHLPYNKFWLSNFLKIALHGDSFFKRSVWKSKMLLPLDICGVPHLLNAQPHRQDTKFEDLAMADFILFRGHTFK